MKRFRLLIVLSAWPLALIGQTESGKPGGQGGWEKVAEPPSATAANPMTRDSENSRDRFHFTRTTVPLADGYTYTSVPAGVFRARSSDIESHPHDVVWSPLEGFPKSGGVSWQAIAWALSPSGDVVTSFAQAPKGSMVTGCPCGYYRLPKGTTKFVSAGGAHPNGVVGYIVPDGKGGFYSETGFGFQIQRSTDGGRSWGSPPGAFASDPYVKTTGTSGGLYALAIIDNALYTGGEGGILKCDLDMRACKEVAGAKAEGYKRNVLSFASNGGPQSPATEIFELGREAGPTAPNAGMILMKWDSTSNTWKIVPQTPILRPWYAAHINSLCKLSGPHEYLLTQYAQVDSQLLYTNDAVHWTKYDTTGLPEFAARFKSLFLAVNPLSGAQYLITVNPSPELYVHK